ncbi:hypothetical protein EPUL_005654, partial [Erysiphe pulchra]
MMFYDFMKRLPHDICFRIADYLYFEDLLRVRLVSRSWYQAFCKTDICAHAIQKQTSLPLEQFFQRFGVNYAELDDKMKDDCHRKYMINRIRREHGIASSIFELEYDLNARDTTFLQYSEGRVVICFSGIIIVEDLKTRLKSVFQYPPNTSHINAGYSRLLGHFFLSAVKNTNLIYNRSDRSGGTEAQLIIWNIISRRIHLISESRDILATTSFQNQVGLIVANPKIYSHNISFLIWNEKRGLKRLLTIKRVQFPNERIIHAGIFFHPSKKGYNENQIFFYAREPPFGWIPPSLRSCKFVHRTIVTTQGPESRWFPVQVSENATPFDQGPAVDQERQPSNIGWESQIRWLERDSGFTPLVQYRIWSDETFYEHFVYDLIARKFTRFNVPLHLTYEECLFGHGSLFWNDQVLIRACHKNVEKLQVITLSKGLSGLWNGSVGKDNSSHSNRSSITRGENRLSCRSSPFEFQDGLQDNPDIEVYGDDNFVVLKAGGRIKVWKFDEF